MSLRCAPTARRALSSVAPGRGALLVDDGEGGVEEPRVGLVEDDEHACRRSKLRPDSVRS